MAHALLSPSSASRWMKCPGSVALSRLFPDETSEYAQEGTIAHAYAAHLLDPTQPKPTEPISSENLAFVNDYVAYVERETAGGMRNIEFSVSVSEVTGEANARGTIDCAALVGNTLKIIDLKFGRGVRVEAEGNLQLSIYAYGAYQYFSLFDEISEIELHIFQPRIDNIGVWRMTPAQLENFVSNARQCAAKALGYLKADPLPPEALVPSADACRFCKAKSACPALREQAAQAVDFKPITEAGDSIPIIPEEALSPEKLGQNLQIADLLEPWIAAVREQAHQQMLQGVAIDGYKLVLGRPGNRQWTSSAEAEEMLKKFKLKENERYSYKIISPTQAEKLFKAGRIGQRQWPQLEQLITRSEPSPMVAPQSDKRPAWTPVAQPTDFQSI